MNLLNFP